MIDLTDFTSIPRKFYSPVPESVSKPLAPQDTKKKAMSPIDPNLVDSELREVWERESRKPTEVRKHLWNINDFEGVPYDAEDAGRIRKERGIPEPDEMIKASEHVE